MKVGIVTLPLHTNYGGILQAYALQTVLSRMGHDVKVIDYDSMKYRPLPIWKMPLAYSKRILKNLLGIRVPILVEQKSYRELPIIRQFTNKFIDAHINRKVIDDFNEIDEYEFDAFVVGSDQVWRPIYFESSFKTNISNAYLGFTKDWDIKRMAYAASFGVDSWEYSLEQTITCKEAISRFDYISVRERAAINMCESNLGVEAQFVLDPTMLLDSEDYISLIGKDINKLPKGGIMTYILDETNSKRIFVDNISQILGMKAFSSKAKSVDINSKITDRVQPPIEDWLHGFMTSNVIITDSFHACVFSILFKKPFLVIVNEDRGSSRFQSLLSLFGLENRIIKSDQTLTREFIEAPLPDSVYEILKSMREKSFNFLSLLNHE